MSLKAYAIVGGMRAPEPLRADEIVIELAPRQELRLSVGDSEDVLTVRLEWDEAHPQSLVVHPGAANLLRLGIREKAGQRGQ